MPPRNQKTPHGDVTLTSRWKEDRSRYLLMAYGSSMALRWMFPKVENFETRPKGFRHTFDPAPTAITDDRVLQKVRHYVPHAGLTWEIDVYDGILKGVEIAEVELDREDRVLELPDWVGKEITGNSRYSKISMEKAAKRRERRNKS